jgi:tRNA pseudouridine13 synthase
MSEPFELPDWPRAHAGPLAPGRLKCSADDFQVEEVLGFEPADQGNFVWLQVEKLAANSRWIAKRLADFCQCPLADVGYAGLKDRQSVSRQWFSIALSQVREPDWQQLDATEMRILQVRRHPQPLRRGDHAANRFVIRLRAFSADREQVDALLHRIAQQGFPNYFGEQRFGIDHTNLSMARQWFAGKLHPKRSEQGFYLSAVRALLFNQVLAHRVAQDHWYRPLPGDLMESAESGHCFSLPRINERAMQRVLAGELSPTGPLWGSGEPRPTGEAGALEQQLLAGQRDWMAGLQRQRVRADRRPLRCMPSALRWCHEADGLRLEFALPGGSYATALVREIAG